MLHGNQELARRRATRAKWERAHGNDGDSWGENGSTNGRGGFGGDGGGEDGLGERGSAAAADLDSGDGDGIHVNLAGVLLGNALIDWTVQMNFFDRFAAAAKAQYVISTASAPRAARRALLLRLAHAAARCPRANSSFAPPTSTPPPTPPLFRVRPADMAWTC